MKPVLGLIPARAGSKEIPGKNMRLLAGRPLLFYTADAAQRSGVIDRLVLSTDSEEIAEVGRSLGVEVPFIRPSELATDAAPMLPVVQHAVRQLEAAGWKPEVVVVLQPTAPLRTPEHIQRALEMLELTGADSIVSVVQVPHQYSPEYVMRIESGRLVNYLKESASVTRRQDTEATYSRDGTVYAVKRDVVLEEDSLYGEDCRPLVLSPDESVNLDTHEDWAAAERKMATSINDP